MWVTWLWETKSPVSVERFGGKECKKEPPPAEQSLRWWLKHFQETGSVFDQKGVGRPSVSTGE